jgi:hypothetical protein|nr:MAG TPA: helix-turn-helix domain protein [Caudoviricetes sp.]
MPRELKEYRDNLEALLGFFGDKRLVTASEVARYTGRDRRTVAKLYNIQKEGITLPTLARRMCR